MDCNCGMSLLSQHTFCLASADAFPTNSVSLPLCTHVEFPRWNLLGAYGRFSIKLNITWRNSSTLVTLFSITIEYLRNPQRLPSLSPCPLSSFRNSFACSQQEHRPSVTVLQLWNLHGLLQAFDLLEFCLCAEAGMSMISLMNCDCGASVT